MTNYLSSQLQTSQVFRHACQTPLTTLMTATELAVSSDHKQGEQKTYLNLAKNAAQRLHELFNSLDQPSKNRSFSSIEAVYEAATLISPRRADLRIVIDKNLQQLSPKLRGNKLYFTESLICLLNNAHEATPESRGVPLIVLAVYMRGKTHIQLDIIDNGVGMTVLSPTYVIWRRRSKNHPGRSVGVHFAYQTLTNMFHAHLITTSSPHGTRVSISLPLHKKHIRKTDMFLHTRNIYQDAIEFVSRIRQGKPSLAGLLPLPTPQR